MPPASRKNADIVRHQDWVATPCRIYNTTAEFCASLFLLTVALLITALPAFTQVPVISGVANADSNLPLTSVTPQILIVIKGQYS